jgi:hypothetical protein
MRKLKVAAGIYKAARISSQNISHFQSVLEIQQIQAPGSNRPTLMLRSGDYQLYGIHFWFITRRFHPQLILI